MLGKSYLQQLQPSAESDHHDLNENLDKISAFKKDGGDSYDRNTRLRLCRQSTNSDKWRKKVGQRGQDTQGSTSFIITRTFFKQHNFQLTISKVL